MELKKFIKYQSDFKAIPRAAQKGSPETEGFN